MDDNSDLFLLTQQFFSGQFKQVIESKQDFIGTDYELKYLEYYYRSKLSLGLFEDVILETKSGETLQDQVFQFFGKSLQQNIEISEFDELIGTNLQDELVLKIGSIYLTKFGKLDQAISNIEKSQTSDLETLSILVLLRIYSNNLTKLHEELTNLKKISNDSIIYNLVESFVNSVLGNPQSAFYFFEEIEQQFPNFQNHLQLLCLNLQLLQIPESGEILENNLKQNEAEDLNGDLIPNQITYNILQGISGNDELITKLESKNPDHVFLKDFKEKNLLFDEIVAKYK